MDRKNPERGYFNTSHFVILGCYTVFAVLLIAESLLLGWEIWALILIALSVALCWAIHIRQSLPDYTRIWIYASLMMMSSFFYGTHVTSTFDLGLLLTVLILIFVSTGIPGLITLCQCTYYLAMCYDLILMYLAGEKFDSLTVSRVLLHLVVITVICFLGRNMISQWNSIMDKSEEEKQEMAETTERLNDFLANISHEIRTPVNAVIGLSRVSAGKVQDEEVRKDLLSIMEAGQKIGDQIGDILDYSEVDMGSLAVNEEDYMITSLLHDVIAEITPLKRPDLELIIDVDPRIPATMRSDVTKLKKIFRHLIDNALKYTEEGGVYVHITPEEREYGINLLLEVTDTGIDMSPSELEMVFERFYQADSGKTRSANGLGLGLSIVNGFVRSLNGFLSIESEPQAGTTVRVSIPQKIIGSDYCMSIREPERLSLGAYLHFEKFTNPHVRDFYNATVKDLVLGLGVK
ncbi:MAG: HAMP domain-containing histidine kinase, partial [Lachnospiraceae bacterium]|nr:HAMP domain-containing histidine kinase [Lachnospiraceae bacterium]